MTTYFLEIGIKHLVHIHYFTLNMAEWCVFQYLKHIHGIFILLNIGISIVKRFLELFRN